MMQCSRCGRQLTLDDRHAPCPGCGQTVSSESVAPWKSIARLSNLAEAGFYADYLEGEGFAARVHHRHDYSALDSTWMTSFELQVPADQTKLAHAALQQGLELHEDDGLAGAEAAEWEAESPHRLRRESRGGGGDEVETRARSTVLPSLVWVLVAGGLAYTLGRSGFGASGPAAQEVILEVIRHSSPFISEPAEGNPRRCLRYDPHRREFVLEEDRNGDGVWDRQWRFAPQP
jgi:hypothetical protein